MPISLAPIPGNNGEGLVRYRTGVPAMVEVMPTPRTARVAAFTLSAFAIGTVLFTGCHRSSSGAPERLSPPENTGTAVIDMNGRWLVTAVEIIEQHVPNGGPGKVGTNTGLLPVAVGTVVTIQDRLLTKAGTWALRREAVESDTQEVFTYLNMTDGRFALYDLGSRSRPDPRIADGGSSRAQLVMGSIDDNTMLGLSAFEINTAPFPGDRPNKGLYRVRLERQ